MTTDIDTQEVLRDRLLYDLFVIQADQAGGFNNLSGDLGGTPDAEEFDIRRSVVPGRLSVTLFVFDSLLGGYDSWSGAYECDPCANLIKVKWEPANGSFYSVIPWSEIEKRWSRIERQIRLAHQDGLHELAQSRLCRYYRTRPERATELATELGITEFLP